MNLKKVPRFEVHSHSHYSNIRLIDSINRPKDLLKTAADLGMNGLAITDHECLSGHVDFLIELKKLKEKEKVPKDFKLALGNEIYLVNSRESKQKYFHFILIAKNKDGHKALRELSSKAWYSSYYDRGIERVPTLKKELKEIIEKYPNSLIATTACIGGELGYLVRDLIEAENKKNEELIQSIKTEIVSFLSFCYTLFGEDFYIEVAPSTSSDQLTFNKKVKQIAAGINLPMVIGTDAHYLTKRDRQVHKAYLNSKNGEREVDDFYGYAHLMDNEEAFSYMYPFFTEEEFVKMCKNSVEIMSKIEEYDLAATQEIPLEEVEQFTKGLHSDLYNDYPYIEKFCNSDNEQDRYWINYCLRELGNKDLWNSLYLTRINTEADILYFVSETLKQPLSAYHNTLQHYIDLFWECGSIVGPGRGSACGWLTNYLLGITQLDPIKWELNEWRYLNKERAEIGDIDIDLAPSKREAIFREIRKRKSELQLLQVCTFGTEGTRSAILAACRGYRSSEFSEGIDSDTAQYMSGMIEQERGFLFTLSDTVNGNEEKGRHPNKKFIQEVGKYPGLLDIMTSIEGLVNKRSSHASGVVLFNGSPYDTTAIMRTPSGDLVTQYDLHNAEYMGCIKFDFLVTEVTDKIIACIDLLQKDSILPKDLNLRQLYDKYLHPDVLDLTNEMIWKALENNEVIDCFQFSNDVGIVAAREIKPVTPLEMTAANALMRLMAERGQERPIERYCRLKFDIEQWYQEMSDYGLTKADVKVLEPHYKQHYGTPPFQESMMLILMDKDISGFTLSEANNARKIVGKKLMDKIPGLRDQFFSKCTNKLLAKYVWETAIQPQLG